MEALIALAMVIFVISLGYGLAKQSEAETTRRSVWDGFAARHGMQRAGLDVEKGVEGTVGGVWVSLRIKGKGKDDQAVYTLEVATDAHPALEIGPRGTFSALFGSLDDGDGPDRAFAETVKVRGLDTSSQPYLHSSVREPLLRLVGDHDATLERGKLRIRRRNAYKDFTDPAWLDARLKELLAVAGAIAAIPQRADEALAHLVRTDADARVRRHAFGVLVRRGDVLAGAVADELLELDPSLRGRGTGAEVMLLLRVEAAKRAARFDVLCDLAEADEALVSVRVAATNALAEWRAEEHVERCLEGLLDSGEPAIRNAAIGALGRAVGGSLAISELDGPLAALSLAPDASGGALSEVEGEAEESADGRAGELADAEAAVAVEPDEA